MKVQLYIAGQQLELFKDEAISLTSSIQNVRDVSKVFTDFSKSFTLPASRSNNKIFKHYYNFDINDGFDARSKQSASIELNYMPYKTGYIQLNGVKLKNNKAHTYNVTFFGDTVNLKDLFNEEKLSVLPLSAYNHDYDSATVENGLEDYVDINSAGGAIAADIVRYPLISHSNRLYYDSSETTADTSNLNYNASYNRGAYYLDLKPALRVAEIIDAIETKYGITFSSDFFSTSNTAFASLYLWLHRNKGNIGEGVSGASVYSTVCQSWTHSSGDTFNIGQDTWSAVVNTYINWSSTITITPTDSGKIYTIIAKDYISGTELARKSNVSGTQTLGFSLISQNYYTIKWIVEATEALTFTPTVEITETDNYYTPPTVSTGTYTCGAISSISSINIADNMPDIKVLDFLTGLFKLFNLTAYVDDSTIVVKSLDSFYSAGSSHDISEYIDTSEKSVDMALPFSEVSFKYKEPKTFLALNYKRINNTIFGDLDYTADIDKGKNYKVEAPFEHLLYEKLSDADGSSTLAQWGWMADDKQEPTIGAPVLFYIANTACSSDKISFKGTSSVSGLSTYNRPANSIGTQTLNFGTETDEWTGTTDDDSLFENYYKNYIQEVFNSKTRLVKVKAYLPLKILLNYSLADRFVIDNQSYKINSINTNFLTGESKLELINETT